MKFYLKYLGILQILENFSKSNKKTRKNLLMKIKEISPKPLKGKIKIMGSLYCVWGKNE